MHAWLPGVRPEECARAMGVTKGIFRSYEEGKRAPSLPELEMLAYYLKLPIDHFWGKASLSGEQPPTEPLDLPRLVELRQRMIGALLRQERNNASLSLKALSQETGIPGGRIKAYELGERPIPLPELEALIAALASRIENFFDQSGPIGQWIGDEKSMRQFLRAAQGSAGLCVPAGESSVSGSGPQAERHVERSIALGGRRPARYHFVIAKLVGHPTW